jgi:hypothetical protein
MPQEIIIICDQQDGHVIRVVDKSTFLKIHNDYSHSSIYVTAVNGKEYPISISIKEYLRLNNV